jgi:hypothetical protein
MAADRRDRGPNGLGMKTPPGINRQGARGAQAGWLSASSGPGVVREIAQRLRLNGWGIVLLGVAYALIEEGLALQPIFNPEGMDGEMVYGRAAGVNWFWAVLVCGYHVVWSVLIPIGVVHILCAGESRSP